MNEQKKYYPSIGQSVNLLLTLLWVGLLFVILFRFLSIGLSGLGLSLPEALTEVLMYTLTLGIIIWIGIKRRRKYNGDARISLSFNKTSGLAILLLLATTLCMGTIIDPFVNAIPMPESIQHFFEDLLFSTSRYPVIAVISIAILPGILEELLFRGIILDGFLKNYKPGKAIFISALFFGCFHLNPWQFIGAFAGGLLLGWTYWKTRSLLLCMLMHAINNLSALLQYWNTNHINDSMYERLGKQNFVLFYIATVVAFIGCMRALNKRLKSNNASKLPI